MPDQRAATNLQHERKPSTGSGTRRQPHAGQNKWRVNDRMSATIKARTPAYEDDALKQSISFQAFILPPSQVGKAVDEREYYLQRSEARSHAAKVSHARARDDGRKRAGWPREMPVVLAQERTDQSFSTNGRRKANMTVWDAEADSFAAIVASNPQQVAQIPSSPRVPQSVGNGGLDPFLPLAVDIPIQDRLHLHKCKHATSRLLCLLLPVFRCCLTLIARRPSRQYISIVRVLAFILHHFRDQEESHEKGRCLLSHPLDCHS
jgi:hypothetical protein